MSRLATAILQTGTAFSAGHQAPMLDLQLGGQMGYAPDLTEWVSNQAYIRKNLICLLIEAPLGFKDLPNPEYWVGTLRSLVELHARSIDGLNATLEVDVSDTPVGGGGQVHHHFTDVKMTPSNVTFKWDEKYGMPVSTFLRGWITNLLMDPDTKFANLSTMGKKPADMLADMYAATMLFMEPDPTHTHIVKAWLVTNMFPKTTGEITGTRDLTQAGEPLTHDVAFTGIAQYSLGVDAFAQQMLNGINITGANPYNRPAFVQAITQDVAATKKSYSSNVSDLSNSAVRV